MESLKEFKYFDPATGEAINDPQVNLTFDSSGKASWRGKKGGFAKNPGWWIVPETEGERKNLSKAPLNSQILSANQIPTSKKAAELLKAAKDKEATAKAKMAAEQKAEDTKKAAEESAQRRQSIIDNLANSGTLQDEVLKKAINTSQIPIFNEDFARISKGINKVLSVAVESKLLTDTYTADEGTPTEKGISNSAEVSDIVKEIVNNHLSVVEDATGKTSFVYNVKPVDSMTERKHARDRRLVEEEAVNQTGAETSDQPAPQTAPQTPVQTNTAQPAAQPSQQANNQSNTQTSEQSGDAPAQPPENTSATVTLTSADMKLFKNDLAAAIEPILSETLKTIMDAAQSVRFHCSSIGAPTQEDSTNEAEETAKPQQESKDMRVFKRLLEDDEETSEATPTEEASAEKSTDTTDKKEDVEKPAVDADASKVPSFPDNKTLKTIIDKLNQKGNPFETNAAVYNLAYKIDNISPEDRSFDIIVTSKSTTPKEDFWSSFKKKAGKFLKAAGSTLSKAAGVLASDGKMTF